MKLPLSVAVQAVPPLPSTFPQPLASRFTVLYSFPSGTKRQRCWREGSLRVSATRSTLADTDEADCSAAAATAAPQRRRHGTLPFFASSSSSLSSSTAALRSQPQRQPTGRCVRVWKSVGVRANVVYTAMEAAARGAGWKEGEALLFDGIAIQIVAVLELHLIPYDAPAPASDVSVAPATSRCAADVVTDAAVAKEEEEENGAAPWAAEHRENGRADAAEKCEEGVSFCLKGQGMGPCIVPVARVEGEAGRHLSDLAAEAGGGVPITSHRVPPAPDTHPAVHHSTFGCPRLEPHKRSRGCLAQELRESYAHFFSH